jgi:hypothetical protein
MYMYVYTCVQYPLYRRQTYGERKGRRRECVAHSGEGGGLGEGQGGGGEDGGVGRDVLYQEEAAKVPGWWGNST